ncbi:branched-chain amino acid ABC transporter permease [Allofranklinella schreckenbergeri]|uniref:Branched-chain amino acid ABC transporter permease n=2 Tax=Comamonadaceae TaxID=80864 RepID=A0A2A2AGE9_9BURK|nr:MULTISPECIES: branched-chain amino acid ABC transporter permease [Comamonadaceae]PAT36834.1 branched-chain amino acid ABC transporter permease [Vandammella animalimorsus]RMX02697.1 branched-chain amino acid ABC transporter permease [Allofranklinella schreckenbergeri]
MDFSIASILLQDGLTNGAVYALVGMALILIFSVTRVIFVAHGELIAFAAIAMAQLQEGVVPGVLWLLLGLGALTFAVDAAVTLWRLRAGTQRSAANLGRSAAFNLGLPLLAWALLAHTSLGQSGLPAQLLLTALLVVPMGPMLYRLAFQPAAEASTLVLLIIAVGVHFMLLGLGLLVLGPEGARSEALSQWQWQLGAVSISGQGLLVIAASMTMIVALYLIFEHTLTGKALRATAINRTGARLMGIAPAQSGAIAFTLATLMAVLAGVLAGPLTTMQYDTGFLIALKGFVAAMVGALSSYPLAWVGSVLVGLVESFGSFWASAYKEVIVFTLIIPVLVWRSLQNPHSEEH